MRKLHANDFEIGQPEGWTDHSTISMIGPLRPTFSPNVQVNQEAVPTGRTAADFFAEQRAEMAKDLAGFAIVEQGDRKLGGQRAEYHTYVWKIPQGVMIRQMQLAAVYGGQLYTVTCSAMDADWPSFEAAFDMIVAGFRFRPATSISA